jgi:two-component system, OmpR family, sensor kinase
MRAIRSRWPTSLRWRLTAWVAGVMIVSAAVVFAVVYANTGNQLRSQIDHDLRGDTTQLSEFLRPLAGQPTNVITAAADRYFSNQPYSATSTLLFVLIPGGATASNHPEVFGGPPDNGETAAAQARENVLGVSLKVPRMGFSTQPVPDVGQARMLERPLTVGGINVIAGAGEPLQTVERAQHGIADAFVLAGAVTLALALIASYLVGGQVTAPLRRMAGVAARVEAGELEPRMDDAPAQGRELQVLADSFNHMLDRLAEAFAAQRAFVADASHELRTPLTVIRGQLEVLAAEENPSEDEVRRVERLVQAEITRISRLVDDLLVLAQSGQTNFLRTEPIQLQPFVQDLWDGMSLIDDRRFELGLVPEGSLDADPDRLAQAIRNLARNSVDHTETGSGLVALDVQRVGSDRIRFAVIDDGPGIPPAERERVFERFHRVDPARSRSDGGAGLGLAIVLAIAEAHGGQVRATDSPNGHGARVELVLPGFRPS